MAPPGLAVEFLGLPGSGKSTLSRRVAEHLLRQGRPVEQPSHALAHGISRAERLARKSARVAREALCHPADALRALGAMRGTQRRTGDYVRMAFNWLLVADLLRRRPAGGGIHLHDQAVLQALWSIGFGGVPGAARRVAARLGDRVPRADVVVIVRVSREAMLRRLAGRVDRDSRLDEAAGDPDAVRRASEQLEEVLAILEGWRGAARAPRVIEVDNESDASLDGTAVRLAAAVQLLFTPS
jgi:thymidylate kinase